MNLIDTHAHLDEIEDLPGAIREASDAGVVAIVAVGMSYESNEKVIELSHQYKNLVYPALGLHPWQLGQIDAAGVERILRQIEDNIHEAVAVGEVGLDYDKRVRALASKERQQAVLRDLLELARKHSKPALIHSRYAWKDALTVAAESGIEEAVFHWYTGPSSVLRDIIARGYFVSATPAAEYHAEHRRAVREAPLTGLLLETDSPVRYGMEVKYTSAPKDVRRSLKAAVEIRGMEEATLAEQTTKNAIRLFKMRVSD
ncbi:MAG: putative deoxyribonuclease YjjV [Dehalococcoidia bacterium]|nr:putative deoxyribonuclease YjjV [Dehalococcoidia bacterium]